MSTFSFGSFPSYLAIIADVGARLKTVAPYGGLTDNQPSVPIPQQ